MLIEVTGKKLVGRGGFLHHILNSVKKIQFISRAETKVSWSLWYTVKKPHKTYTNEDWSTNKYWRVYDPLIWPSTLCYIDNLYWKFEIVLICVFFLFQKCVENPNTWCVILDKPRTWPNWYCNSTTNFIKCTSWLLEH